MPTAPLHDGTRVAYQIHGSGPTVLLPVDPVPKEGAAAGELRRWGMDPALGRALAEGLGDAFQVVAFDYEGHRMGHPAAALTPTHLAADLLAVADAAGAGRFAYYGYSWLALAGLQLALRTDRLTALAMGGFPPLGGPYAQMLRVTAAAHTMALRPRTPAAGPERDTPSGGGEEYDWSGVQIAADGAQTGQFLGLYQALEGFDEAAAQRLVDCPRLCFAGSADVIPYGPEWGGVTVDMAGPLTRERARLEAAGWQVRVLDGLDHTGAMQPGAVLPVLRPWLAAAHAD
ncbi:alpha/beta hydrolase [Streptomyces sp. SID8014]|uniref:alpha/beta fold hydrolase n=1 Tax=Streptomyces sp. SID8014 TaxID=2706097 RepID=UPI0013BAFEBE|nr:alpha/beta hydrolase [Streptomyces sp. SID8014]NEC14522.1 alpha/beta hydrolase [Streptomyces sp. SID8014]